MFNDFFESIIVVLPMASLRPNASEIEVRVYNLSNAIIIKFLHTLLLYCIYQNMQSLQQ